MTCQRCSAKLKLDRKPILRLGTSCFLVFCIIGFVGARWYINNAHAPQAHPSLAIAGFLLFCAVMLLAIKAWAWRIYRYAVEGAAGT